MSARIHLRNLAFNWGSHAASLLVMFFLSPYIVGKLDAVSYGIWSLLNVLTGYMGLFDLGVRASVGRHIALYIGKKDERGVDETIRAGLGFFTLTGGLILAIGVLLGWFFPEFFKSVPEEYHSVVRMLLPIMALNVWFSAVAAIYSSVLVAIDRFDVARSVQLGVLAIRTAATVYVLHVGWGLWGLAFSVIASNFIALLINQVCAGTHYPQLRSWPFLFSRFRFGEILNYGLAAFVSAVAFKIIGQTDLIVVGAFISVEDVRDYSVGAMVVFYSITFVKLIGRTFFPAIQRAVAGGEVNKARHYLERQIRIAWCFGGLMFVGFAVYSRSFIDLWMRQDGFDESSVAAAALVMTILAVSQIPLLFNQPCQDMLAAMGNIHFNAAMALLESLLNLGLSLYFVIILHFGVAGVAAGTLISRLLTSSFAIPLYLCKKTAMPLSRFAKVNLLPGLVSMPLLAAFCQSMIGLRPPSDWISFSVHVALASMYWGMISAAILAPKDYRERAFRALRTRFSGSCP